MREVVESVGLDVERLMDQAGSEVIKNRLFANTSRSVMTGCLQCWYVMMIPPSGQWMRVCVVSQHFV